MSEYTHKMVNGERVLLTREEVADFERDAREFKPLAAPTSAEEIDAYVAKTDVKTLIADLLKRQAGIT
jgi:hypothetical protein